MMNSLLLALLFAAPSQRVAVHDLSGAGDLEVRSALTAQIRSALQRAGVFKLIAAEDQAALDAELVKQLEEGCEDECLEALGGALQANLLLRGSLGRVGSAITLDLKLIDLGTRQTVRTASRSVEGVIEDVLPMIEPMAAELSGLERMPMEEVEGVAVLPLQSEGATKKDRVAWAAAVVSAADRTGRFRALMAGDRLVRRLPKAMLKQAGACGEEGCVASVAKAVKLPYGLMVSVEPAEGVYRVTALIARSKDGKRMALESMTAPDHHSVISALRAVLTSTVTRSFDPSAPRLHSAMKVSVIAGADPKLRAKRGALLRYGGIGLLAVGSGLGGYGYVQTTSAASGLDAASAAEWAELWQQGKSGQSAQFAGAGVAAVGAALTVWSFVQ
jgi:hypothetical protein